MPKTEDPEQPENKESIVKVEEKLEKPEVSKSKVNLDEENLDKEEMGSDKTEELKESPVQEAKEEKTIKYDALQNLFLIVHENFTSTDLEDFIQENSLYYSESESENSKFYKVAKDEAITPFRYAEGGDYITLDFEPDTGVIHSCEYIYTHNGYDGYSSVIYTPYGDHGKLRGNKYPEQRAGYYVTKHPAMNSKNNEGVTIVYENDYQQKWNYFQCESAEEAMNTLLPH